MLPLLEVSGCARERGRAHGEALRESVERALELWQVRLGLVADAGGSESRAAYLEAAERWTPGSVEELRGIAEGANVPFSAVLELNLADERRVFASADRCSSAGLRRSGHAAPVSGQTMDTPEWFSELRVAVRAAQEETGLASLAFTVAGIPALCGINSAGASVWCNALEQLPASPHGVPVSFLVSHLLSVRSLGEAQSFLRAVPHASGQHYLLGSPEGLLSLECSARSVVETRGGADAVWHTNHAVANGDAVDSAASANSLARDVFIGEALASAGSAAELCAVFEDRTVPVCKVGGAGGDGYTLWAVVAEHGAPPTVLASAGPPTRGGWFPVELTHVQR